MLLLSIFAAVGLRECGLWAVGICGAVGYCYVGMRAVAEAVSALWVGRLVGPRGVGVEGSGKLPAWLSRPDAYIYAWIRRDEIEIGPLTPPYQVIRLWGGKLL